MVDEMAKLVFTIPLNIRNPDARQCEVACFCHQVW